MINKYYSMRELLLLLSISIFSPLAIADKPDAPVPPQILKAADIQNVKASNILINKISTLIEKKEHNYTFAKLISDQDGQIILNYDYQYGWRASDVVQHTLIYKKSNSDWLLIDTINFSMDEKSIVGDLTGDGITELLVFDRSGFRNMIMSEEIIMIYDAATGKYIKSGLTARTEATVGECNDVENTYNNISIEKSVPSPIVVVTLKRTKVNKSDCEEVQTFTSRHEYEWSAKQKKFIYVSVASSLLRWARGLI